MNARHLLIPTCALALLAFERAASDRLTCEPVPGENLTLSTSMGLSAEFIGGSVSTDGVEISEALWNPEFDAEALRGERAVAVELQLMPAGADERSIWLAVAEVDGEALEAVGELAVGHGVRFLREDGAWSGVAIDEDGEELDVEARNALSASALFEALLPEDDVQPGESWRVELGSAAAAGLLLPGLGFDLAADLMPEQTEGTDGADLGSALRAQLPRMLAEAAGQLELECRYGERRGGVARLEYVGVGTLELGPGEPFSWAIRLGGTEDGPGATEATATAELELELAGRLDWDLEGARPVEHALEGTFNARLRIEALVEFFFPDVPITAELEWQGDLFSAARVD